MIFRCCQKKVAINGNGDKKKTCDALQVFDFNGSPYGNRTHVAGMKILFPPVKTA
jgi:hypothetical protein